MPLGFLPALPGSPPSQASASLRAELQPGSPQPAPGIWGSRPTHSAPNEADPPSPAKGSAVRSRGGAALAAGCRERRPSFRAPWVPWALGGGRLFNDLFVSSLIWCRVGYKQLDPKSEHSPGRGGLWFGSAGVGRLGF